MYLQNVGNVFDLKWVGDVTYGDVHHRGEVAFSTDNFEQAGVHSGDSACFVYLRIMYAIRSYYDPATGRVNGLRLMKDSPVRSMRYL